MVQRTYYPPPEPTYVTREVQDTGPLHGYTVHDIDLAARRSAFSNKFLAHNHFDLVDAAWDAIVDGLLTSEATPTMHDLHTWGRAGIWSLVKGHRQTHGYGRDAYASAASAPHFVAYWTDRGREPAIDVMLERIALAQTWAQLDDQSQRLLGALAACGSYAAAAEALGYTHRTYVIYVVRAARAAQALWHDGETPHRISHYMHRRQRDVPQQPCGTHAAYRRHRKRGEKACPECYEAQYRFERDRAARRAGARDA